MQRVTHKACNNCRAKKIRCKYLSGSVCEFCNSRRLPCAFSYQKPRRKRKQRSQGAYPLMSCPDVDLSSEQLNLPLPRANADLMSSSSHSDPQQESMTLALQDSSDLFIDFLLADRRSSKTNLSDHLPDQLNTIFGPNPNISFFPPRRVRSISERLGHNRLEQLLEEIRRILAAKMRNSNTIPGVDLLRNRDRDLGCTHEGTNRDLINHHIRSYMELVHPLYPFLTRETLGKRAFSPDLTQDLATDKSWAALYYAIAAIGCQYNDGGSFEAGVGEAWSYFERSVSYFQDIVFSKGSLTSLQALIAMAVFSQTFSGFQFQSLMLSQATIMSQNLGINRSNGLQEVSLHRTFWVLYYLEKTSSFVTGRIPNLQDSFISCPLPEVKESAFEDYDWFFNFVKYSRLISKIHSRLFAISSVPKPAAVYNATVQKLRLEVEEWRISIPVRFRPGESLKPRLLPEPLALVVALQTHYYYLNAVLALSWTLLYCGSDSLEVSQQLELKKEVMHTARSVLELTAYIEVASSTPIWILGIMPLSALMILFDLVIHNPNHPETSLSLALLDMAGGHFSRLEFASKGALPGSLLSEFAHIARQYVSDVRALKGRRHPAPSVPRQGNLGTNYHTPTRPRWPRYPDIPVPADGGSIPASENATENSQVAEESHAQSMPAPPGTGGFMSDSIAAPLPTIASTPDDNTSLFLSLIDDPSYQLEQLQILGVDLMDLFDVPYPTAGEESAP